MVATSGLATDSLWWTPRFGLLIGALWQNTVGQKWRCAGVLNLARDQSSLPFCIVCAALLATSAAIVARPVCMLRYGQTCRTSCSQTMSSSPESRHGLACVLCDTQCVCQVSLRSVIVGLIADTRVKIDGHAGAYVQLNVGGCYPL